MTNKEKLLMDINENINLCEDYVSFEIAKLLKENGFNESNCLHYYKENGDTCINPKSVPNWRLYSWYGKATLQMAMKWLRVVYSLEIYPYHNSPDNRHNSEWWFEIIKYPNSVAEYESGIDEEVDTYEQACEAAIKYCLEKLI